MSKHFNVNGICFPSKHYMVDISEKIRQIERLIQQGYYFTMNRARQYGKTTTLSLLEEHLQEEYYVINISFEGVGETYFSSEQEFVQGFIHSVEEMMEYTPAIREIYDFWMQSSGEVSNMSQLGRHISAFCGTCTKPVILMIDEVDKSSDNQIFLSFLGMLRNKYLQRMKIPTFYSVILAGVYDIKNLKLKLRSNEEKKYNSPWNVAVDFDIDMSFSADGIKTMLTEYVEDHQCSMNPDVMAEEIFQYTEGYPFLVSYVCKIMDEQRYEWTSENLRLVVKRMLQGTNTLFDDIIKNLENHESFRRIVHAILLSGEEVAFVLSNPGIALGTMFGIFKNYDGRVKISNKIFEMYIYEYMISVSRTENLKLDGYGDKSLYIQDGKLNMDLVIARFAQFLKSEYREEDGNFVEQQGRLLFLSFLRPIINGTGHYAVEAQTRKNARMDIQVFYGNEEFIVELKMWHGMNYEQKGYKQLTEYLKARGVKKGYLISFCRNQSQPLENRVFEVEGHIISETIVMY